LTMQDTDADKRTDRGLPFLRWAGSKRKLIPVLSEYYPHDTTRYVEPFAGSACLFFHLHPKRALLCDLNRDLIETYRAIQLDVERVIECIRRLPVGKAAYYKVRAVDPTRLTLAEQAARFIYLNKYCFNGLYRTNQRGEFNVPFGNTKGADRISEERLRSASRNLDEVTLVCGDFSVALELTLPGDFVYMDPPYKVSDRRMFAEYQAAEFTYHDVSRLHSHLRKLDKRGIPFLVSYASSPEAEDLARGWNSEEVKTARSIAGFCGSRGSVHEVLVTNLTLRGVHA